MGERVVSLASGPSALVMNVTVTMPTASDKLTVFPNPSSSAWVQRDDAGPRFLLATARLFAGRNWLDNLVQR